jgi:hypothetical protein
MNEHPYMMAQNVNKIVTIYLIGYEVLLDGHFSPLFPSSPLLP